MSIAPTEAQRPLRVVILCPEIGAGNRTDAGQLKALLETAGMRASVEGSRSLAARVRGRITKLLFGTRRYDVGLAIESLSGPGYLRLATRWCLAVNPEWLLPYTVEHIARFDLVLAKTSDAVSRLATMGQPVAYTGWTTTDQFLPGHGPKQRVALHVGGTSYQKGTADLIGVWNQQPEWPLLVVVSSVLTPEVQALARQTPNIRLHTEFLDRNGPLRRLMNEAMWHICPSEMEGFGHTIAEGMSCGAVVVTTDGPPMNVLVRPDRGVLIPPGPAAPHNYGIQHQVDREALRATLAGVFAAGERLLEELGPRARQWYVEENRRARAAIVAAVRSLGPA